MANSKSRCDSGPWDAVDAAREKLRYELAEIPKNGFTTDDYCARYNVNRETGRNQLKRMVKAGLLEMGHARSKRSDGSAGVFVVYWPK